MSRLKINLSDPYGHVNMLQFGSGGRPRGGQLDKLYAELGSVRPTAAEQLLREAYLDDYQIRDPNNRKPLDIVSIHPKTDTTEGGYLRTRMRNFQMYGVKDVFGESWSTFRKLPFHEAEFMLEICKVQAEQNSSTANKLHREMDRDLKEAQKKG